MSSSRRLIQTPTKVSWLRRLPCCNLRRRTRRRSHSHRRRVERTRPTSLRKDLRKIFARPLLRQTKTMSRRRKPALLREPTRASPRETKRTSRQTNLSLSSPRRPPSSTSQTSIPRKRLSKLMPLPLVRTSKLPTNEGARK